MTPMMIITMVLCFALSVSVAVSIGLASIVGLQVSNANMLISVKEIFNSINKFPLAAIPFFICMVICIALITVFPQIVTILPDLVMGKEL